MRQPWPCRSIQSVEVMEYRVGKIDAAVAQLDWAIRLFLDHREYVPSITLAGAAEEIIGAPLGQEAAFHKLKDILSNKYNIQAPLVARDYLNKAKNRLKHWRDMKDEEYTDLELETEAIQYIVRARANLVSYDQTITSESPRFLNWLSEHRRDLL